MDISDLPEDLIRELSFGDPFEYQLLEILRDNNGQANLDTVLIGLYRKFKIIRKRRQVQNKLYRMDTVHSIDGMKGVYAINELAEGSQNTDPL